MLSASMKIFTKIFGNTCKRLSVRDCNNYREGLEGKVGKPEGDIGENLDETEEAGARCKILYIRRGGALLFSYPFVNWKKGRRTLRV